MFAQDEDIEDCERMIVSVLNAASAGWDAAFDDARRTAEAVSKSRILATMEICRAIAKNPQHGLWGVFARPVEIEHNSFLPAHEGAHGVPVIVLANSGGYERTGLPADPDEIDSYREDDIRQFSKTPHDRLDGNDLPSELSGYYSIINNLLKFTGKYCSVPMIRLPGYSAADDETPSDQNTYWNEHTPVFSIPTIIKLAPFYNLKEGDNLMGLAQTMYLEGQKDLRAIEGGAMTVSPVAPIAEIQKEI